MDGDFLMGSFLSLASGRISESRLKNPCLFLFSFEFPVFFCSLAFVVLYPKKGGGVNLMGLDQCRLKKLTD